MKRTSRQERAAETRAEVFNSAAQLFARVGYHGTTVAQIAERAGVAKGTFFFHFATKDAVIEELVRGQVMEARHAREAVLAKKGASYLDALRETALELARQAGRSRPLSRAVLIASMESIEAGVRAGALFEALFETMIEDAESARQAGEVQGHVEAETIASLFMTSYLGAALSFTTTEKPRPMVEILAPLLDVHIQGLRGDRAGRPQRPALARRRSGRRSR